MIHAALSQNICLELRLGLPDAEGAKHNFSSLGRNAETFTYLAYRDNIALNMSNRLLPSPMLQHDSWAYKTSVCGIIPPFWELML